MERTGLFVLATLFTGSVFAQTASLRGKIASIMTNDNYIYGDVTSETQEKAMEVAKEMLRMRVNEWVATQKNFSGASKVVTLNTNYEVEQITMPRANMYRAFLYVKKSDVLPAGSVDVEERKTVPSVPASTLAAGGETVRDALPGMGTTSQLAAKLKEWKSSGAVLEYDKLNNLTERDLTEYVVVVFTREGRIEAVLSEGSSRRNLKTGADDQISNYKGCGAIGIKIKK